MNDRSLRPELINLKNHSASSEKGAQNLGAQDPSILGSSKDLFLRDKKRRQSRAGRLDLLPADTETPRRSRVEILRLGATDASHISRTIAHGDVEKKCSPQYGRCAVSGAEERTSRFLTLSGSRGSMYPQRKRPLWPTKCSTSCGNPTPVRTEWTTNATSALRRVANHPILWHSIRRRRPFVFRPQLPCPDGLDEKRDEAGFGTLPDIHHDPCRLRVTKGDIQSKSAIPEELWRLACEHRAGA